METEDTKYACTKGKENPDKTQGNQKPGVRGKEGRREGGKKGGREGGREGKGMEEEQQMKRTSHLHVPSLSTMTTIVCGIAPL